MRSETEDRGTDSFRPQLRTEKEQHRRANELYGQLEASEPAVHLRRLGEMGFSDAEIAQVLHREIPVIDHLRTCVQPEHGPQHRLTHATHHRLALFMAACDTIAELGIEAVAAWFRTPLLPSRSETPLDLADKAAGFEIDYAAGYVTAQEALEQLRIWWAEQTSC
ncbi:hypothetical protein ACFRQM_40190 [Streptomyces sp. NPDC056831]|uniref:hypothetical protein n=1 Tax=Streptomyces sp. NPDC056831 TaxID=3345954 RepID=UPI00369BD295